MGHADELCEPMARQIFARTNGELWICSSDALKSRLYALSSATLADTEPSRSIVGVCSPSAIEQNATAVLVEAGNPDELAAVYSGIRTGQSLENHLIYRTPLIFNNKELYPALRTVYTDFKWLNGVFALFADPQIGQLTI